MHVACATGQGAVPLLRHAGTRVPEIGCPYHGKSLEKVNREVHVLRKVNEVTLPGYVPGAQIKTIQRVTTVPRSLLHSLHITAS